MDNSLQNGPFTGSEKISKVFNKEEKERICDEKEEGGESLEKKESWREGEEENCKINPDAETRYKIRRSKKTKKANLRGETQRRKSKKKKVKKENFRAFAPSRVSTASPHRNTSIKFGPLFVKTLQILNLTETLLAKINNTTILHSSPKSSPPLSSPSSSSIHGSRDKGLTQQRPNNLAMGRFIDDDSDDFVAAG